MSTTFGLLFLQLACLSIVSVISYQTSSHRINSVTTSIIFPAGYIHYPSINTAFKVHRERRNWSDAQQICISEGGRLAVVDTKEKVRYINAQKSRHAVVWVGITKKRSYWVAANTNSRLKHLPWAPRQPSGVGICVAVKSNGSGLSNKLCMWAKSFACEIPSTTTVSRGPLPIWSNSNSGI